MEKFLWLITISPQSMIEYSPSPGTVVVWLICGTVIVAALVGTALPDDTLPKGTVVMTDQGEASSDELSGMGPSTYTYESLEPQMQEYVDRVLAADGSVRTESPVAYEYAPVIETPMTYEYIVVTKDDTAYRIGITTQYQHPAFNFFLHNPFLVMILWVGISAIPLYLVSRTIDSSAGPTTDDEPE